MEGLAGALLAVAVLVGVVGTVVPLMPGPVVVGAAAIGYALWAQKTPVTVAAGVALLVLAAGWALKYAVPAKKVGGEVDRLSLIVGGIAALIGFFVIPIVGLLVGFIVGVFGTELVRTRSPAEAVPATRTALYAAGLSMLIDLCATVLAGGIIITAAVLA